MGLVGPRHCPGHREVSPALSWHQTLSLCLSCAPLCTVLLSRGHLCPSHLVAPDICKKSHWCGL